MNRDNYAIILELICRMNNIDENELNKLMKDKETKYLIILLMKKYECLDYNRMNKDLNYTSKRAIKYNENKAEEKLLINYDFRKKFFELEEIIDNIG